MVLKPEAMQRVLVVSSKKWQAPLIEALHDLRVTHFIDYEERRDGEFAEFRIGAPLPSGAPASERLVRVRALLRNLGVEGSEPSRVLPVRDLEARLDATLDQVESTVNRAAETRESLRVALAESRELEAKLDPLRALPLKLEDYRGYEALSVFTGRADPEFEAGLRAAAPDAQLVRGEGTLFALFVPNAQASAASDLLYRHGYAEVEVPEGSGTPDERLRALVSERAALESRLDKAEAEMGRLAQEHRDFLVAAEEHLSIVVEKAEAPLAFASTENAFVVDAWVPASDVGGVEAAVKRATGDNVHFVRLETSDDVAHAHHAHAPNGHEHGHDHGHGGVDAGFTAHPAARAPTAIPPTKYDNPRSTAQFQWFTNLFSTPRFDEVDPTTVFAIFFPLFFGFMIGDLGLGLLMVGLGFLMIRKLHRVDGMKQLGTALLVAGVVAAALGGLVFKDALGIPLGFTHHMDEELTAEGIAAGCNPEVYHALGETTWGCLLGMGPVHAEPLIYKVTDISTMLLISVGAALVHLLIGLLIGVKNEWGHGGKHLAAKFGYLLLLVSFWPAAVALLDAGFLHAMLGLTAMNAYALAGGGFLVGAVILGWAEGAPGVLEIPSLFSNILSYLRLGAVAIAKGAMAVAFNNLTLVSIGLGGGGVLMFVLGLIAFLAAQAVLFVLGLLSGGIQALRLNFVEFFTKFYKGGGTPFKPFGRERRHTTTGAATVNATAATAVLTPPLNP
jgi:V/A-type H+-transporting ATPase subunit I